ncbi:MAG: hypothetical protein E7539_02490 [Ruminococcaceae bacterium]|nr:hypothetical protein [Oscillospiraceae bacterium]
MITLIKNGLKIGVDETNGAILVSQEGSRHSYQTVAADSEYSVSNARLEDDKILFDVSRPEKKQGEVQLGEAVPDAQTLVHACFEIENEEVLCAKLTMSSNARFKKPFNYPPAFDVQKGDTHIIPYNEGIALDADDPNADVLLYGDHKMNVCQFSVMAMWGLLRENRSGPYLLCACDTNYDAGVNFSRDDDGYFRARPYFEPQKSFWGYDRVLRFVVSDEGSVTAMCKNYRKFAEKRGFVRTLKEKAKAVPNVDKMIGAADVWLFNDDAMYKLYNKDAKYTPPTAEQYKKRRDIADDMEKRGIKRVMWSIFDENVDRETVDYIKDKGYLTTVYDVFTDVIQHPIASLMTETRYKRCEPRLAYWPNGIAITENGCLMTAWQLMGKDGNYYYQSRMCDQMCVECAKERIPALNSKINVDGWFLDVVYNFSYECYSPEHPMTRRDSLYYKGQLEKFIEDSGLICGTEIGREDGVPYCVYNEGMLSINEWRSNQAGRRMCELYYGDEIGKTITSYMLNPAYRLPLWELVYHDCMISYWYWGDSHNCCPELMPKRDLFCNLYGVPALFSFNAANYEKLADSIETSYKNTSPLAQELGYEQMTGFEYLSEDYKVQKTQFSNGTCVYVNFSDKAFTLENGEVIAANDKLVTRK